MIWIIATTTLIMLILCSLWMIGIHQILSDIRNHLSSINRLIK